MVGNTFPGWPTASTLGCCWIFSSSSVKSTRKTHDQNEGSLLLCFMTMAKLFNAIVFLMCKWEWWYLLYDLVDLLWGSSVIEYSQIFIDKNKAVLLQTSLGLTLHFPKAMARKLGFWHITEKWRFGGSGWGEEVSLKRALLIWLVSCLPHGLFVIHLFYFIVTIRICNNRYACLLIHFLFCKAVGLMRV